jgi:hypothetical protein
MALVDSLRRTMQLPSGQYTRFHCKFTCWSLWLRMCEKEIDMPLLARLPRSMHSRRHGCCLVSTVRAVVQAIWKRSLKEAFGSLYKNLKTKHACRASRALLRTGATVGAIIARLDAKDPCSNAILGPERKVAGTGASVEFKSGLRINFEQT